MSSQQAIGHRKRRGAVVISTALLLSTIGLVSTPNAASAAVPSTPGCTAWPNSSGESLQAAVTADFCVVLTPGHYSIDSGIKIPFGHSLIGEPGQQNSTWLIANPASPSWDQDPNLAMLGAAKAIVPSTVDAQVPVLIQGFSLWGSAGFDSTLQGNSFDGAQVGITTPNAIIDQMTVTHVRCDALRSYGEGVPGLISTGVAAVVTDSKIYNNGAECSAGHAPPGAGIYLQDSGGQTTGRVYIAYNQIYDNDGAAIDDNGVNDGTLIDNTMTISSAQFPLVHPTQMSTSWNYDGWATVSIADGSGWTIADNTISAPQSLARPNSQCSNTNAPYPYAGPGDAGILVCGHNAPAANETILRNSIDARWGIVAVSYGAAANGSKIIGNTISSSVINCAENVNEASGSNANFWRDNGCNGSGLNDSGPNHFNG